MGVAAALLAPFTSHPSGRSQGLLPVCKRGKAEVPKPGGLPHMCPPPPADYMCSAPCHLSHLSPPGDKAKGKSGLHPPPALQLLVLVFGAP